MFNPCRFFLFVVYMATEAISLGWNCESAGKGVQLGIRKTKANGYQTCPFDECITNYDGIVLCLKEDFKHFCDIAYLQIIPAAFSTGGIVKNEPLLYNTRYNFIFNHESPEHANLYLSQSWSGGKNHYVDNNFALFIERYNRRIESFRTYLDNNKITFVIGKNDDNISELSETIKEKYPKLNYDIMCYRPNDTITVVEEHHILMKR